MAPAALSQRVEVKVHLHREKAVVTRRPCHLCIARYAPGYEMLHLYYNLCFSLSQPELFRKVSSYTRCPQSSLQIRLWKYLRGR